MKHRDPAGLGRAVELEEPRIGEHLHDGALGVGPRRGRRDHQLADAVEPELRSHGMR